MCYQSDTKLHILYYLDWHICNVLILSMDQSTNPHMVHFVQAILLHCLYYNFVDLVFDLFGKLTWGDVLISKSTGISLWSQTDFHFLHNLRKFQVDNCFHFKNLKYINLKLVEVLSFDHDWSNKNWVHFTFSFVNSGIRIGQLEYMLSFLCIFGFFPHRWRCLS